VRLLRRMLLRQFVPIFLVALVFFVLILQLLDIFGSIWRYLAQDVSLAQIAAIALLYLPKCIAFALPVSFLFAISFTLGLFYANNELFAIFGSGVSLHRLVIPFLAIGVALSAAGFFFEDAVVIPTFQAKNELYSKAVKQTTTLSQSNVTVTSPDQRMVYVADYYNDAQMRLTGVTVIERDAQMNLSSRMDGAWAEWTTSRWVLHDARIFTWDPSSRILSERREATWDSPLLSEPPDTFRKLARSVEEMNQAETRRYVTMIKRAGMTGQPYREALTGYYRKFSFACTPFIVAFIASSLGSTFKKNILLMSLLTSLIISVVFYVAQMVAAILAKNGYLPPLAAAWSPFSLFLVLGFMLFRTART
jgi:lipopolysaccharide export system permease protein